MEALSFLSLKEFLKHCLEGEVDFVALSGHLAEKNIGFLSNIFRFFLERPVLIFGEEEGFDGDIVFTPRECDGVILGQITAHKLWDQILGKKKRDGLFFTRG